MEREYGHAPILADLQTYPSRFVEKMVNLFGFSPYVQPPPSCEEKAKLIRTQKDMGNAAGISRHRTGDEVHSQQQVGPLIGNQAVNTSYMYQKR